MIWAVVPAGTTNASASVAYSASVTATIVPAAKKAGAEKAAARSLWFASWRVSSWFEGRRARSRAADEGAAFHPQRDLHRDRLRRIPDPRVGRRRAGLDLNQDRAAGGRRDREADEREGGDDRPRGCAGAWDRLASCRRTWRRRERASVGSAWGGSSICVMDGERPRATPRSGNPPCARAAAPPGTPGSGIGLQFGYASFIGAATFPAASRRESPIHRQRSGRVDGLQALAHGNPHGGRRRPPARARHGR